MAAASLTQPKPNLETYSLIWLDSSAGESQDNIHAQRHLRTIINYIKLFKQSNECFEYIKSLSKYDRIIIIVSGRLGQEIVPKIHPFRQISSIYVYCMNKKQNEQWARQFNKIKHIIVNLNELVNKIRDDQIEQQRNKVNESFPIDIFQANTTNNNFIYSYLLINCLIETNSSLNDKNDLLTLCKQQYEDNENELKILEEFEENYSPSRALSWYTRPSCISRLLKKALQVQNIELLLLFRFFIRDIQRQLEKTKCTSTIRVYYGQIMSNDEIEIFKNNIGGFVLINSFLSTNSRQQIQTYFSQLEYSNDFQCVLFDIEADPQLENIKPFSAIKTQGFVPNEEQTLFMLGSVFRLINVRHEQDGMWIVRMKLCSEDEEELKSIFDRNQTRDALSFGQEFCKLRRFDEAEKYYHHLLKSLPSDHEDHILYYDALGNLEKDKDDYDSCLQYFNKSLEIKINILEVDHPSIGDSYNDIGEIYLKENDFKQAFDSFNKAINIYKKNFGDDHPKIATCFNNMGHVYKKDKKYPKALEFYQKAFGIRQKCLPPDHHQLADSYKNIGIAYECLNDSDQALDNYDRSLKIFEKSASPPRFVIGMIFESIGGIYETKKELQKARSNYEKAVKNFRYVLSETDPRIIQIQEYIQRVSTQLK